MAATGLVILPRLDPNRQLFGRCDFEIWQMTMKNNREPLPCSLKLCVSFHSHPIIWIGATNRKRSNQGQSVSFSPRVTFKFDRWPWKTIGHLFYATQSFMHNFVAICEFKIELQSGNTQFGLKLVIFVSRATLKFVRRPWKTQGHLSYATSSCVHHFVAIGEFKMELQSGNAQFGSNRRFFVPCNLEILQTTFTKQ